MSLLKHLKPKLTEKTSQAESSPEGCGKLAGDNIPGYHPQETPRPEGAPEPTSSIQSSTNPPIPPSSPYAGRCTQDIIAECEEKYAQQKAARLNRQRQNETAETPCDSEHKPPVLKRELSDYDKALREGKTHEEALYAQFTPVPKDKPPEEAVNSMSNPPDAVRAPVYQAPQSGPTSRLPPPLYGPVEPPLTLSHLP